MNKYVKQLVELCEYDREIDGFLPKIEQISNTLKAKNDEIAALQTQISQNNTEIEELKTSVSQTNAQIKEFSAKIKEISKKQNSVKTEKEIKALNLEDEIAREQLNTANDDIANFEKKIEIKKDLKKSLSDNEKALKDEYKELEKELKGKLDEIEAERGKISEKKYELLKKMDQKIISFYEKIRIWAGNTAVVPVRKQACYGCFMKINDKTFISVTKSDDIVTCPHCGRILYKETDKNA